MSQDKINTRQHREKAREIKAPKYCTTKKERDRERERKSVRQPIRLVDHLEIATSIVRSNVGYLRYVDHIFVNKANRF